MKKNDAYKMIQVKNETYYLLKKVQEDFSSATGGKISLGQIIHTMIQKNSEVK